MNLPNVSISNSSQATSEPGHEHNGNGHGTAVYTVPKALSRKQKMLTLRPNTDRGERDSEMGEFPYGEQLDVGNEQYAEDTVGGIRHSDDSATLIYHAMPVTAVSGPASPSEQSIDDQSRVLTHRGQPIAFSFPPTHTESSGDANPVQSDNVIALPHDDCGSLEPIGKWRCCKCNHGSDVVYYTKGAHPVSVLNCACTHRSCSNCTLEGQIKRFQPMKEPEIVQLTEDGLNEIRFGVFCDACGLSWRAEEVGNKNMSTVQRISSAPKRLVKRGAHPLQKLRHAKSMTDLSIHRCNDTTLTSQSSFNLRALSNEMEKGHGKQAECATVRFTGIKCTCGYPTWSASLCFQVVDPPIDVYEAEFQGLMAERKVAMVPKFTSTAEDQTKGHETPILILKGGRHPNPLRSNPVTD